MNKDNWDDEPDYVISALVSKCTCTNPSILRAQRAAETLRISKGNLACTAFMILTRSR